MTIDENDLITTAEMARLLKVQPNTLEVWRATKRYDLPYVKIGRSVRYSRSAAAQFISKNTKVPA
jgi:excisionase family DNA binding protein